MKEPFANALSNGVGIGWSSSREPRTASSPEPSHRVEGTLSTASHCALGLDQPVGGAQHEFVGCPWCEAEDAQAVVPPGCPTAAPSMPEVFCWTKMQAEAGQSLELILARKELERAAGNGLFFWGVGTSLGRRLFALLKLVPRPKVVFSIMRAKPKPKDALPDAVALWASYTDALGRTRRLPSHALVLSRASTKSGPKRHHYALACHSEHSVRLQPAGSLQLGHFRNWGSDNPRIGSSQVTAIIEHRPAVEEGPRYGLDVVAELADPYFVRLEEPVLVPSKERELLDSLVNRSKDPADWNEIVSGVRQRLGIV